MLEDQKYFLFMQKSSRMDKIFINNPKTYILGPIDQSWL